ncbi:MAG: polyphosphate kinase 2, partial [Burkholderiaceae bacterium]
MPTKSTSAKSASRSKPTQRSKKTSQPRRASSGDTPTSLTAAGVKKHVVSKAGVRTETQREMTVAEILTKMTSGTSPGEPLEQMKALIAGASPDEAKALRRALFAPETTGPEGVDPDAELSPGWREGAYPYLNLLSRKKYEKQKYQLQVELLKLQAWVKETGQRVVILFEGRDAAGKGGAIKRFMEHLNPRGARVVALEKPNEVERGQW